MTLIPRPVVTVRCPVCEADLDDNRPIDPLRCDACGIFWWDIDSFGDHDGNQCRARVHRALKPATPPAGDEPVRCMRIDGHAGRSDTHSADTHIGLAERDHRYVWPNDWLTPAPDAEATP